MYQFVVAVKRDMKSGIQPDWQNLVRETEGVMVRGATPSRLTIDASLSAIDKVRAILGGALVVEPVRHHHTLQALDLDVE